MALKPSREIPVDEFARRSLENVNKFVSPRFNGESGPTGVRNTFQVVLLFERSETQRGKLDKIKGRKQEESKYLQKSK